MMAGLVVFGSFLIVVGAMIMAIRSFLVRIGPWAKAYQSLGKRYGKKVSFSGNRPRLIFNYGDAQCVLSNIGRKSNHRRTQLKISWPDRWLKLFVSSLGEPVGIMKAWRLKPVDFEHEKLPFLVYCNDPDQARAIIDDTSRWQIQQLMSHGGESGIEIFLSSGQLKISKPGFIKHDLMLDDFVRFALGLADQFKLAISKDLEFVSQPEAVVLEDVTCPICSDKIEFEMVTCVRCKTPHCADCWEYNGQCATFACNETRFMKASESRLSQRTSVD